MGDKFIRIKYLSNVYKKAPSGDGKPCCLCDTDDPLLNCYQRRTTKSHFDEISNAIKIIKEECAKNKIICDTCILERFCDSADIFPAPADWPYFGRCDIE